MHETATAEPPRPADSRPEPRRSTRALRRRERRGALIAEPVGTPAVLRRDAIYRRSLAVADVVSAALAVVFALVILGDDTLEPAVALAIPVIVVVSKVIGLYDRDEHLLKKTTLEEVPALFQVATLYTLLIWLGEGVLVHGHLGKLQVIGLWLLLGLSMAAGRVLARRVARDVTAEERVVVLGDERAAGRVRSKLASAPSLGATYVGHFPLKDGRASGAGGGRSSNPLDSLRQLPEVLGAERIDRVVIAPSGSDADLTVDAIRLVKSLGVKVSVLPRLFEVVGSTVEFDDVDGTMFLGVRRYGLGRSSLFLKRVMDTVGAAVTLLLTAPVWIAAAVAIKLTSPGPVLFTQPRIGIDGREFRIFKFRTMYDGADAQKAALRARNEAHGLFKIAEDPRVTAVGQLLRRSSLDELPQMINVLRGDMSLVGPRPLVPEEDGRIEGWQRRRLHVYPGMTGLWQIFGSSRIPLEEMVKIDYLYGANWSLWLDVKILLRTVPYILARRGL